MDQVKSRNQLYQLNWVRAIAALMVVAYHLEITMALSKYFDRAVFPIFKAGSAGVELFFVLSGFVIYYAHHRDRQGDVEAVKKFVFKRFRRLYPPLWIVLIATTAMAFAAGADVSAWDVIAAYLILPVEKEVLLGVEWTLRHEMLFYATFLVWLWNRKIGLAALLGWGVIGSIAGVFFDEPWLLKFLLSPYHLLFMTGMGIGWLFVREDMSHGLATFIAGVIVFAGTWWQVSYGGGADPDYLILLFGLGATGIIYGLCALPSWNRPCKPLDMMGAASYSLYLIHYPLLSLLLKITMIVHAYVPLPLELYFIGIVFACQMAGLLFHYYVEKPVLSLTGRLMQRRQPQPAE